MSKYIDPVELLRREFARRRQKNAAYSLRAFSRALQISPARLSQVLSRKRPVTANQLEKISNTLMLSPAERRAVKRSASPKTATFVDFDREVFEFVSDFQHTAILALFDTRDAKAKPVWIAKRLGISAVEARDSLERLVKLGLLTATSGTLAPTHANLATRSDVPSAALRKLHGQMITKAAASLENHSVDERDITSITMAVDKTKLKEAKAMIREFRRSLCAHLESGDKTEVFTLNIQLFPLTN